MDGAGWTWVELVGIGTPWKVPVRHLEPTLIYHFKEEKRKRLPFS